MKHIYILLMHTRTRMSEFVRLMTRYGYSHVALAFDESCEVIYSFGRREVRSVWNGGFVAERRDGAFFRAYPRADCIIYKMDVTDAQYAAARRLVDEMERARASLRYDFVGTAIRFFGIPVTFRDRYVCSYFVAYVLEYAGIYRFPKPACLVNPKDFYALAGCEEIYRGRYLAWQPAAGLPHNAESCFPPAGAGK